MRSIAGARREALLSKEFSWGWGNEVLYRMCEEKPWHTDLDVISGKIWLIGRAYAAAIERGAGTAKKEGKDFHETIAPKIRDSHLDKWLREVAKIDIVNTENLHLVLAVHQRFTHLLKRLTRRKRRSFASKYLHFHNRNALFIYDIRAAKKIRQKVGRHHFVLPQSCAEADPEYAGFVIRCMKYRDSEAAKNKNTPMTPRELDQTLLDY